MDQQNQIQACGELLKLPEVLALARLSKGSVYRGVAAGTFPAPVRIGARSIAWRSGDVRAWIDSLRVTA